MNPDAPVSPRDELEVRLTALLMGELSPEETAALQAQMANDPELAALHGRLRQASELLREASTIPEPAAPPTPVRLSSERRERLLAHFKRSGGETAVTPTRWDWRWMVPLGLAAALIVFIGGGLLLPTVQYKSSRGAEKAKARMRTLVLSDSEERQWASQPGALRSWGEGGERGGDLALAPSAETATTGGRKFNLPLPSAEPEPAQALPALRITKSGSGTFHLAIPSATPASQPATEAPAPVPPPLPGLAAASASAEPKESPAQPRRLFRNPTPQTRIATGAVEVAAAEPFVLSAPHPTAGKVNLSPDAAGGMGGGGAGGGEPELVRRSVSVANGDRPALSSISGVAATQPAPPPVDFFFDTPANAGSVRPAETKPPMLGDIPITGTLFSTKAAPGSGPGASDKKGGRAGVTVLGRDLAEAQAGSEEGRKGPPIVLNGGQLTLNGSNSYSGGTTISAGTIAMGSGVNISGGFDDSSKLTGKPASPTDRLTSESEGVKGVKHHWSGRFENQLGTSDGTTAFPVTPTTPTAFDSRLVAKDGDFDGFINYGSWIQPQATQPQGPQPQGIDPSATPGISNYRVFSSGGVTADAGRGVSARDGTAAILFGSNGVIANAGQGVAQDGVNQAKNDPEGKDSSTKRFYRNVDELRFISPTADPSAPEAPDKPDAPGKPMEVARLLEPAQKQKLDAVGSNPVTAGNRSGSLAISQNAIDALVFGIAGNSALAPGNSALGLGSIASRRQSSPVLEPLAESEMEPSSSATVTTPTGGDKLKTRAFKVSSDFIKQALTDASRADSENANRTALKDLLAANGMPLGPDAVVSYAPASGKLIIRDTPEQLGLVDAIVSAGEPVKVEKAKEAPADDALAKKPNPDAPVPQPEVPTSANAFSTFSLNVSDVSFKLAAASLEQGQMPEPSGVRSEEFINAFDYRDPEPAADAPLACATERARYPFAQNRDLLRCSVKTAAAGRQPGRALNVVLLLDNSGSMERADRVRIVREALRVLAGQLQPQDKLSIITFARTPRLWADGVAGNEAGAVTARCAEITPQGGTNIAAALDLGYQTALRHYQVGSINRVVLLTDGAANLGDVDPGALKQKVEAHRKQGIALDCFGIGWEGLNDDLLEQLSRNGDGRYGFINTPEEAATEFAGQLAGALRVAASDVKVQVEFNPRRVTAYRQIGYAKHQLTKEQFRDNTVDAAEIGAAESGNALYVIEVNPRGEGDLATVRVRFKVPGTSDYREHEWAVPFIAPAVPLEQASPALRLAGAASAFSEMLAASPYAAEVNSDRLLSLLNGVPAIYGADPRPQKLEWMIRQAKSLSGR